jgi:23S rRNA U2552 (ribose-2'-O)-methylase RlmE/FtsJ
MSTNGKKREASLTRWEPKEWTPTYESIVLLSCAGKANKELAELYDFTPVHISNILNCARAKILRREVLDNLRDRFDETIPVKLQTSALKAAERISDFIEDDSLAEKSPFAFVDRAMSLLRMAGHSKAQDKLPMMGGVVGGSQTNIGAAVVISDMAAQVIADSLKNAEQARLLHEGEFEVLSVGEDRTSD